VLASGSVIKVNDVFKNGNRPYAVNVVHQASIVDDLNSFFGKGILALSYVLGQGSHLR